LNKSWAVSPEWRSRFLANVADMLLVKDTLSDSEVERACVEVSRRMFARGLKGNEQQELRRA
jgi:hypothetical protein